MLGHIRRQPIGKIIAHTRTLVSNLDRGIRTTAHVFNAVKKHLPDGKIKKAAEKGLSDYESVREKIRAGAPPL
jgi:hypothetical protein